MRRAPAGRAAVLLVHHLRRIGHAVHGLLRAARQCAMYHAQVPTFNQEGVVTEIRCETAAEFLAILDPMLGPFAQPTHLGGYVFRGLPSNQYSLLPSAYRPESTVRHQAAWVHPPLPTVSEQCVAEIETLRKFFDIAAREGITLPEDSQAMRSELDEWQIRARAGTADSPIVWPPRELWSLIALAQHYGIPTRALDWTWSSLTAAYFAVVNVDERSSGRLAVWVFSYLATLFDNALHLLYPGERPLILFSAPGAENKNLQAQRGLFMLERHRIVSRDEPFTPRPYENLMEVSVPSAEKKIPLAIRIDVPYAEAPRIRWLLSAAGVTAGRLFPGLWGVAREFNEERLIAVEAFGWPASDFAKQIQREVMKTLKGAAPNSR